MMEKFKLLFSINFATITFQKIHYIHSVQLITYSIEMKIYRSICDSVHLYSSLKMFNRESMTISESPILSPTLPKEDVIALPTKWNQSEK